MRFDGPAHDPRIYTNHHHNVPIRAGSCDLVDRDLVRSQ